VQKRVAMGTGIDKEVISELDRGCGRVRNLGERDAEKRKCISMGR
jgi:hypothetical protein